MNEKEMDEGMFLSKGIRGKVLTLSDRFHEKAVSM